MDLHSSRKAGSGAASPAGQGPAGLWHACDSDESVAQDAEVAQADADQDRADPLANFSVERATLALHGEDGRKCGYELCKAVKQPESKSVSHPHSEESIRVVPGAHDFGCIAV